MDTATINQHAREAINLRSMYRFLDEVPTLDPNPTEFVVVLTDIESGTTARSIIEYGLADWGHDTIEYLAKKCNPKYLEAELTDGTLSHWLDSAFFNAGGSYDNPRYFQETLKSYNNYVLNDSVLYVNGGVVRYNPTRKNGPTSWKTAHVELQITKLGVVDKESVREANAEKLKEWFANTSEKLRNQFDNAIATSNASLKELSK